MAGTVNINTVKVWGMVDGHFVDNPNTPVLAFNYALFKSRADWESYFNGFPQPEMYSGRFGIKGKNALTAPFANGVPKEAGHDIVKKLLSEPLTKAELANTFGVKAARDRMMGAEMDLMEDGETFTVVPLEIINE